MSSVTLNELEDIKTSSRKDEDAKQKARNLLKLLNENMNQFNVAIETSMGHEKLTEMGLPNTPDNLIICAALIVQQTYKDLCFVTDDLACRIIAGCYGLPTQSSKNHVSQESDYRGFLEVTLNNEDCLDFLADMSKNRFGLLRNQYLIIHNIGIDDVGLYKWNGITHIPIDYKRIKSDPQIGQIKPRNIYQELAFDMLQDKATTIKVLTGNWGTGKDFLMVSHGLDLIHRGDIDHIVYIRNNIEVKNTKSIGFLPGNATDKLLPFAMPLADHLGGVDVLMDYIEHGDIILEHLGNGRGRSYKRSLVYVAEAENCTKEHIALLLSRVDEGSMIWINGDCRQTDAPIFDQNNGLKDAINALKGEALFSFVQLQIDERSDTARLAEKLT